MYIYCTISQDHTQCTQLHKHRPPIADSQSERRYFLPYQNNLGWSVALRRSPLINSPQFSLHSTHSLHPLYYYTILYTVTRCSTAIMSKSFTPTDVSSHNNPDKGLYIIIDSNVYDVTKFIDEHPGGSKILKRVAGKDASKQFWKVCSPPPVLGPVRARDDRLTMAVPQRERPEEVLAQVEDRRG